MKTDFLYVELIGGFFPQKPPAAENCTDALRDCSGKRCRADSPMEVTNKQQVQHHIYKRGKDEIVQRMAAVSNCVEYADKNVVHNGENSTEEIVAEVNNRLWEYVGGGSHPAKNGRSEYNTGCRKHDSAAESKGYICVNGFLHGFIVFCAEVPGNDNTGTHGKTVEKAYHHKYKTAGGTDCSQSVVTQKIAYTPGIEGVVKLLKDIAQKNRKGKENQFFPDRTFSKCIAVGIQGETLPSIKV